MSKDDDVVRLSPAVLEMAVSMQIRLNENLGRGNVMLMAVDDARDKLHQNIDKFTEAFSTHDVNDLPKLKRMAADICNYAMSLTCENKDVEEPFGASASYQKVSSVGMSKAKARLNALEEDEPFLFISARDPLFTLAAGLTAELYAWHARPDEAVEYRALRMQGNNYKNNKYRSTQLKKG